MSSPLPTLNRTADRALAHRDRAHGRPTFALLAAMAASGAALLSGCGGASGEGAASVSTASTAADASGTRKGILAVQPGWVTIPAQPDALLQGLVVPANAPAKGLWSASKPWPFNAIHSVLMSDGRVLTFGTLYGIPDAQDGRFFDVWTPELGFGDVAHAGSITPDAVNNFCGLAGWLADGSLLVGGGNGGGGSAVFGKTVGTLSMPSFKTTQSGSSFAAERWYATMVALPDARQLVIGGTVPYASPITSQTPEIYENGAWRSLFGASSKPIFGVRQLGNQTEANPWYYPRAWVAPDGKVFGLTANIMFKIDANANNGAGSVQQVGTFKTVQDGSGATTPNVGFTSTAVMFQPGRILQVGGNGVTDNNGLTASLNASIIDINGAAPVVTEAAPMNFRRHWANANVLPNGQVVVTGGTTVGWAPANAVLAAEIWNPATGTWTVGAAAAETRTYHSSAILLPNGSIFTSGGGAPGAVNNRNSEIYYPPYLFTTVAGQAQLAPRPVITAMSTLQGGYGGTLGIEMNATAAVAKLVLIQSGTVTHSFNTTQRFVPLAFTQNGSTLSATLPANANLAPPGYYMVFALDANGVPSRGVMLSLGGLKAPAAVPAVMPSALPVNAVACAAENAVCNLPGGLRASVYFGARGIFASKSGVLGNIGCNNGVFGDPVAVVKQCYYVPEGPANTNYCAADGGNCVIPAGYTASVSYGANGSYSTLANVSGTVACSAARFGADPLPGISKSCFVSTASTTAIPPVPPSPAPVPTLPSVNAPIITAGTSASYAPALNITGATYSWTFGDGSAPTATSAAPNTNHVFPNAGVYTVTLSVKLADGSTVQKSFFQAVSAPATARAAVASSALALEVRTGASTRAWVVNPDNDSVSVIDTTTNARVAEIAVGKSPRSLAFATDGRVWVSNKDAATISIVSPDSLAVVQTVALPVAAQPHGLAFAPAGSAFVVLEASGQLVKLDPVTAAVQATLAVGPNTRHLSISGDGATVLVSRFITPALPGESTAAVDTGTAGAEVLVVNAGPMTVNKTVVLRHSDKVDTEAQGAGIPNYLAAAVISPDGKSAWVPSKQDNIKRGTLRNALGLNFQNAVRAISSRIDMTTLAEDYSRRVDHDNASLGTAAAYHPSGAYLFVALETSRQVAVLDPVAGRELVKLDVGRAPQALAVSPDGLTLLVQNFMDRTVSVLDLSALQTRGELTLPLKATVATVAAEKLAGQVLLGKQLFYDARDPRLARDSYMSCASCHSDAGHDGRTWDFTGFGEGLRNTPALKGRAGIGQGFAHWSANFDEIQDFEGQIRNFAGGKGLMTDAQFNTGTRSAPLGDKKAGVNGDLDALAAYLSSLDGFDASPNRNTDGTLTAAAAAGKTVFTNANCASCHGGTGFTSSGGATALKNIGTIKPTSGQRLGAVLSGIDVPTLRDIWKTAPYLHDGSAATLQAAVQAHQGNTVAGADLTNLVAYLQQIGSQEAAAPAVPLAPGTAPPAGALACGNEGTVCTLPVGATATVWYGAGTTWASKTGVVGSIACSNAVFGDPVAGTVKSCRYVATSNPPATNKAPTVAFIAPANNTGVVQGTAVNLIATASDVDGTVARVEFYDGVALLATVNAAPFNFNWANAAAGTHTLTAKATDNLGATTTSATITLTVTAGTTTLPAGALAEWTFDAATGPTAPDTSGNGKTLTLRTGASITAAGKAGAALQLAGPNSIGGASTAAPLLNTAGSFSVAGWIRFDQLPACWNQVLASQDGVNVSGFYLGISPPCNGSAPRAAFTMLSVDADASTAYNITDSQTLVTGTWYHLAAVRDAAANTMALYVNGRLAGTVANATKWSAVGPFALGRSKFSGAQRDPAYAAIDGVRAYGRALTQAEVTSLVQAAR